MRAREGSGALPIHIKGEALCADVPAAASKTDRLFIRGGVPYLSQSLYLFQMSYFPLPSALSERPQLRSSRSVGRRDEWHWERESGRLWALERAI